MKSSLSFIIAASLVIILIFADFNNGSSQHHWKKRKKMKKHFCNSGSGHHSSYHRVPAPCTANANPQLPSSVEPMPIDPYRMLGRWYQYLVYFPNGSVNALGYNFVIYFNNLGNETLVPGTDIPALLVEDYESAIDSTTQLCSSGYDGLAYLASDGTIRTTSFGNYNSDPSQYSLGIFSNVVASTDYDSYAFLYECDRVSNSSRSVCEEPYLYVMTRDRPDMVTSTVITRMSKEIDRILGKYCFDSSYMMTRKWFPALGECPNYQPTFDCYTKQYNAAKFLAGTGPSNGRMTPRPRPFRFSFFG
ncbi:uncharacterized protein LOC129591128 [Paramacrobiotus metropolitanus]|uniref:uncharacterized protein LOC129591128 n=1 Tax=Paramacrobiotus metropolitanus TaxID=2943436 RepID=UPI0024463024|nr:uncharacterized protein LOC129591128 [Paramacrobiotus metropolitanus]